VGAVRRVAGGRSYVSGSCGPSGAILKPYGDADPGDVYASFREQILSLVGAGADLIAVETMTDLEEACLAVRAAREISPVVPVIATMTFDATPRGFFTIMGATIEQAAERLVEAGADLVGSNCGNGAERMVEVASEFRRHARVPLVFRPNAGLPEIQDGVAVYPETPQFMAERAVDLLALGVSVIGGCCGTTPDHIRALRRMVDSRFKEIAR
jgi:5-methyltetrahydrofolate--homocysteine methyltransferase